MVSFSHLFLLSSWSFLIMSMIVSTISDPGYELRQPSHLCLSSGGAAAVEAILRLLHLPCFLLFLSKCILHYPGSIVKLVAWSLWLKAPSLMKIILKWLMDARSSSSQRCSINKWTNGPHSTSRSRSKLTNASLTPTWIGDQLH